MRRAAGALVVAVALSGGAEVSVAATGPIDGPRALARVAPESAFALAGDAALVPRMRGRLLTIRSVPLAGSGPQPDGFRFQAPAGAQPTARLSASAQRAGLVVTTEDDRSELRAAQAFSGPPGGPWDPLGPLQELAEDAFFPSEPKVDGQTLATLEFRGDLSEARFVVREPGAAERVVILPRDAISPAFAGDLIAYALRVRRGDEPRRLVVRNWRTGEQRAALTMPVGIVALDLRADGAVVVEQSGGGLRELRGSRLRRLTRGGTGPAYAGERIVFVRGSELAGHRHLAVMEPTGRVRSLGAPSAAIDGFLADDTHVLWSAHGCLLVADVTSRAAAAPAAGPCPRSELLLDDSGPSPALRRSRRVPLRLRCVAAAPPGCRGTLRLDLVGPKTLRASRPLRFRIPAGRTRRLMPRLTRRGYAEAIRAARIGFGGVGMQVDAIAVDPAGRRSRLRAGYSIEVPR